MVSVLYYNNKYLVDSLWFSHGGLDSQRFDILPIFLEERNQEINCQVQVLNKLVIRHTNITNGNIQAKNFLHLELDGGLDIIDFTKHIVLVSQHSWEFTSLVQAWAQKTWDLFDQGFRSKESIVLLGKLLDQFLVLVELISEHVWDTLRFGFVIVSSITNNANLLLWSWDVWQFDGTRETFIFLWIVVLQSNLKLDGFQEFSLLLFGALEDFSNRFVQGITRDL